MRFLPIPAVALLVFAGPAASALADMPSFYLSTDKLFTTSEDAVVKVESRNVKALDVRVYRVTDPDAFFRAQENPYQVRAAGKRGPSLGQMAAAFAGSLRDDAAAALRRKVDTDKLARPLRRVFKSVFRVLDQKPRPALKGYLKDYPLVREFSVPLKPADGGWNQNLVALPLYAKGVYLVEGLAGKDAGYTVAVVSDLAVVTKHAGNALVLFAANRHSGRPERAEVSLFRPDTAFRSGRQTTDGDGLASWRAGDNLLGRLYAAAAGPSGYALHDSTFYPSSSFGVEGLKVYLYTDRPMYKPGQELFFRGVARLYTGGGYRVPALSRDRLSVEILDPSGAVVATPAFEYSAFGSLDGTWTAPANTKPGLYRLVAKADGRAYETLFKVENYVKPPFEIQVLPDKNAFSFGEQVKGLVKAKYFFGGEVRGAETRWYVYRQERFQSQYLGTPFGWYLQDNEYRNTREELVHEGKGATDERGELRFSFAANAENLQGKAYDYRIEVRIKDASGRLVTGSAGVQVLEGDFFLLVQSEKNYFTPGERGVFEVKAVPYAGGTVEPEVTARVVYYEWNAQTMSEAAQKVTVHERTLRATGGSAKFEYRFAKAGHYYVEVAARDKTGNKVTSGKFAWVAADADKLLVAGTGLQIIPDKAVYQPGDTAKILVVSPVPDVSVLHVVEGDDVARYGVLRIAGNSAVLEVRVTEKMVPNAFLSLACLQGDRLYTAQKQLFVPPRDKFLAVETDGLLPSYAPGAKVKFAVTVKDRAGRPVRGEVSVAVTDQAIYALQPQLVLDIEKFFYHPHRNNVATASSLYTRFYGYAEEDRLEGALRRKPDTAFADLAKGKAREFQSGERKTFKDRAFWTARVVTGADGKGEVSFDLPDNLTAWRVSAVAVDGGDRVGSLHKRFVAKKDFFARTVLPEKLMEGETAVISAVVHNQTARDAACTVEMEAGGAVALADARLARHAVAVPAGGERAVSWRVKAGDPGKGSFRVTVRGPQADVAVRELDVRPFGRRLWASANGTLAGAAPARFDFALPPQAQLKTAKLTVRVTPSLVHLVEDSLKYLVGYPYGCVEQTLSRFIPDLYALKMMGEIPFKDEFLKKNLPELVQAGITRLGTLQNSDGGWGWFGGAGGQDVFMSAYAVYALAVAGKLGYQSQVDGLLRSGARWLDRQLAGSSDWDPALRAFVLYALSEHRKDRSTQVAKALGQLVPGDDASAVFLALAALDSPAELGAAPVMARLASRLRVGAVDAGLPGDGHPTSWRQDPNVANAMLLRLLVKRGGSKDVCAKLVNRLLAAREDEAWRSTFDTSLILLAFTEYSKKYLADNPDLRAAVTVNGKVYAEEKVGFGRVLDVPWRELVAGGNRVAVVGSAGLFYSGGVSYWSRQASFAPLSGGGIAVARSYYELAPAGRGKYRVEREVSGSVKRGATLLVTVRVTARKMVDYFMLDEPLLSGGQYIEEKDDTLVEGVRLNEYLAHEVGTGAVAFFRRFVPAGTTEFSYLVLPTMAGEFRLLPAVGKSMYYPEQAGSSASQVLRVVE